MATLRADLAPGTDPQVARRSIEGGLAEHFGVGHATVETHGPHGPAEAPRSWHGAGS